MQLGTTEAKVPLPLQGNPAIVIHADSGRKSRTWRLPQTRGSKVLFKEQPGAPELQEDEEDETGFLQFFQVNIRQVSPKYILILLLLLL